MSSPRDGLDRLGNRIRAARGRIRSLAELLKGASPGGRRRAAGIGSPDLGLDSQPTAARLESTADVTGSTTSITTTSPSFQGASTSAPTLGGTYDGSLGDETLTFTATEGGIVGSSQLTFEVRDSQGSLVDTVTMPGGTPAGTAFQSSIGIELELSFGLVVQGDQFEVGVSVTSGTPVDPDNPFDGVGAAGPGFGVGVNVVAGSFDINGTTITVDADDSISSVIQKIDGADAGVTAAFDTGRQRLVLTAAAAGAAGQILLENDDTGFLSALHVDGATVVAGHDDESSAAIDQVSRFSAVVDGGFSINGIAIAVHPGTDSLVDVLDRINSAGAGVIATFDFDSGKVAIRSTSRSSPLEIGSDDSGLLSAIGVDEGRYEAKVGSSRLGGTDRRRLSEGLGELSRILATVFSEGFSGTARLEQDRFLTEFSRVSSDLEKRTRHGHRAPGRFETGLGVTLHFRRGEEGLLEFDPEAFREGLRSDAAASLEFLGAGGEEGFLAFLDEALAETEGRLGGGGSVGSVLDRLA